MSLPSQKRLPLFLLKGNKLEKAKFAECILHYFKNQQTESNCIEISCYLKENKVILSDEENEEKYLFMHPAFCPAACLDATTAGSISEQSGDRGVQVGSTIILQTSDLRVLLTRRPAFFRSFPSVWVPPGGHVELNETLAEAGVRELNEETGLNLMPHDYAISTLALWESVYPPVLSQGPPRKHHLVVYHLLVTPHSSEALQWRLKLQPEEVSACTWLTVQQVRIALGIEPLSAAPTPTFRASCLDINSGQLRDEEVETAVLANQVSESGIGGGPEPLQRVSTGTKFALKQWLNTLSAN